MNSETETPVNTSELKQVPPASPGTLANDPLQAHISALEKKLDNPYLSKRRRDKLEKQLTRLKVKQAVDKP